MQKTNLFFIAVCVLILSVVPVSATESALEITLSGSSPDGYQLQMAIPYKSGMNSDFSNIRFYSGNTRYNGGISIPYWVESYTANTSATVWVPVPLNAAKLYCQWGISGETSSESNASAVMLLYDDFTGSSGNSPDASKWTVSKQGDASAQVQLDGSGNLVLKGVDYIEASGVLASKDSFSRECVVEYSDKVSAHKYSAVGFGNGTAQDYLGGISKWRVTYLPNGYATSEELGPSTSIVMVSPVYPAVNETTSSGSSLMYPALDTYYRHKIIWTSSGNFITYRDDAQVQAAGNSTYTSGKVYFSQGSYSTGASPINTVDWVLVRLFDTAPVTASVSGTVLTAPNADFSADKITGNYPLDVMFTDSSAGSPTSWLWTFGDGNTSSLQNPTHRYSTIGTYTVSLNVTNTIGSSTKTMTDYITAKDTPSIAFSANITDGASPLEVQFTDASSSNTVSWVWNFGDGNTSTLQNPVHVYALSGSATDATYTVQLTGTSAANDSTTLTKYSYIHVASDTNSAFTASQTSTVINDNIVFTDSSSCDPVSWAWNFGDGSTSTLQNPSHSYTKSGDYTVTLTVKDANNTMYTRAKQAYISITTAPAVSFTAVPVSGYEPLTIAFTDMSTLGGLSTWLWNFGDGTTSTERNPTHTYSTAGSYSVTLTVSNSAGTDTETRTNYITVSHLYAAFTANVTSGTAYADVKFTDQSMGSPTSWSWDFGGGAASSTEQSPEVHFAVPGLYTVSLTVANAYGLDTETKTGYIRIADNGTSVPMKITNVTHLWAYVPLNTSTDFMFSSDQPVVISHYQLNGGQVVNATNMSMAYTFTEPGYYWMDVWAENQNGVSEKIQYRIRVGRALATEHVEPINDSAYYDLENSTLNMTTDGILVALVAPFTESIGRSFYLVLFVLPFIFLWFQQGKLTIPTTLALITGALFIGYIPDTYTTFIGLAIVMSFAANFYKISRGT